MPRFLGTAVLYGVLSMSPAAGVSAGSPEGAKPSPGERLFTHNFGLPDPAFETLQRKGDGLGPVFNGFSCASCHRQAGIGGGGELEKNIRVINLIVPENADARERDRIVREATKIHPGFSAGLSTMPLHHFGMPAGGDAVAYEDFLIGVLTKLGIEGDSPLPVRRTIAGVTYEVAERHTTALWGLGVIEEFRLKGGDDIRRRLMEEMNQKYRKIGISGRVPRDPAQHESWYGWRGHQPTLHDFNLGACSNELGLSVPGVTQPEDPRLTPGERRLRLENEQLDLTDSECRELTAFVASLPRPQQIIPEQPDIAQRIIEGERIFNRVACNACHVRDLGWIEGIYSDMLLHDLGHRLCDGMKAEPEISPGEVLPAGPPVASGRGGGGGYYTQSLVSSPGGTFAIPPKVIPTETGCEWRTAPLWGVADSAPYLHDGRAPTIHEAILWHDGEAAESRFAYQELSPDEQAKLQEFLLSLRAPQSAPAGPAMPQLANATLSNPSAANDAHPAASVLPAAEAGPPQEVVAQDDPAPAISLLEATPLAVPASDANLLKAWLQPKAPVTVRTSKAGAGSTASKLPEGASALLIYARGLALKQQLDHAGALQAQQSAASLEDPFAWRARQMLIREQLRLRQYDDALTAIADLARAAARDTDESHAYDRQETLRWAGRILGYFAGPSGMQSQTATAAELLSALRVELPESAAAIVTYGRTETARIEEQLLADRAETLKKEEEARREKSGSLLGKQADVAEQRQSLAANQVEARQQLDAETRKLQVRADELEQQQNRCEDLEVAMLQSVVTLKQALAQVESGNPNQNSLNRARADVQSQLDLINLKRTENAAKSQSILSEAETLLAQLKQLSDQYGRATGDSAKQLTTLSKLEKRLEQQQARNESADAEKSPAVLGIDRRLRTLATYDQFSISAEMAAILARLPGKESLSTTRTD